MICPQCQEIEKDGARFCSNCGLSFSSFYTPTEQAEELPETLPTLDPLVGQVLDGKYELLAHLGEGNMGAVHRARRVHIGDEVAVKVLLRKYVADSSLVERFRREARAAAMLRHPNVVIIHDYGETRSEDAPAYIVMELVEGISLRQLLQRESRLSPERAIRLMRDTCAGVGAAHRRNVFHRDLKPDNVIVLPPDEDREHETVKVVDFGLAKLRDAAGAPTLTQTGMIMGTPYYMSPEQCRGEHLDARADVYSLGTMLYEMLAGVPPFTAQNIAGVIAKHLTEAPPPLPETLSIPPALEALIMRSLAKDQNARPADATDLARELRAEEEARGAQPKQIRTGNKAQGMTNRVGMEFMGIPAGSFMMGSVSGDSREKPVHRVTISEGFYMGKYEVTQAQWPAMMGNSPSYFKGDDLPVEQVSWDDAVAFVAKLNALSDGYVYRLPTEAEWEYAARAGTTGDYAGDLDAMAWYAATSGRKTHPVGQKQPNAFGLFDMHGNVWEWCADWFHLSYAGAPADGSAWLSGGEQRYRVLRGGSWDRNAYDCRSAYRVGYEPGERNVRLGFRVVASART